MTYIPENAPKKHHICTKIPVIPATTYINSIIAHQNHFKPPNPRHYSRTFNQTHLIIKQTHPNKPIRSKILFKITLHSPISQRNFTTRISGTAIIDKFNFIEFIGSQPNIRHIQASETRRKHQEPIKQNRDHQQRGTLSATTFYTEHHEGGNLRKIQKT